MNCNTSLKKFLIFLCSFVFYHFAFYDPWNSFVVFCNFSLQYKFYHILGCCVLRFIIPEIVIFLCSIAFYHFVQPHIYLVSILFQITVKLGILKALPHIFLLSDKLFHIFRICLSNCCPVSLFSFSLHFYLLFLNILSLTFCVLFNIFHIRLLYLTTPITDCLYWT